MSNLTDDLFRELSDEQALQEYSWIMQCRTDKGRIKRIRTIFNYGVCEGHRQAEEMDREFEKAQSVANEWR